MEVEQGMGPLALWVRDVGPMVGGLGNPIPGQIVAEKDNLIGVVWGVGLGG